MAAKLKKRALAEFSHVIQEEPKPVKRLRLVHKPAQSELRLNLQSGSSSQEVLQGLVTLEQSFPIDQATAERLFPELMEHYNGKRDALVRSKILNIFTKLAAVPGFNPQVISDQLLPKLQTEESHKVRSNILSALTTIGCYLPNSLSFHHQLVTLAHQLLTNGSHLVRARCLDLIGELGSSDEKTRELTTADNALHLLGQYTSDSDPRVRAAAFVAMLRLYDRGQSLSQSVYSKACSGLSDDNEDVRRKATKLVWVLCRLYPESMVSSGSEDGEDLRLVDDGFAKICDMMNDISVKVRVESAGLLGSLHQVSGRFLEQTLDKKLMSNMRRKVSAHERAKELFESGEWSFGAVWADDKPRRDVDADSVSLMNIGACGAFVHGLEDEFLEVRNAALDSLCELAVHSARFAVLSQDSIIDMVNDEIETVRLNAIHSLRKLSGHLTLRDDQLEIILGGLQDFSYSSREAVRGLLGELRIATRESIYRTIMDLLKNLNDYPEDRTSIYSCSQKIGLRHSQLTMMIAPELLCLHPYFHSPEPDYEDSAYITILLLVFNAASVCPTMVALFPEHTRRHYTYLRCSIPHLVPSIEGLDVEKEQGRGQVVATAAMSTVEFLQQLLSKLSGLSSLDLDSAEQLLRICVRDLEHAETLDSQMSAATECISLFLCSQLILTELIKRMESDSDKVYQESFSASVNKVLQQTTQLQTLFLGLGGELTSMIRQTEVKVLAVHLKLILEQSSVVEKVRTCNTFNQFIGLIKNSVESDPASYDNFTRQVVSLDWSRLQKLPGIFHDLGKVLRPTSLTLPRDVLKITAVIEEPPPVSDNLLMFPAGLATTVTMVATVCNLEDTNRVSILVHYPDQRMNHVIPALSCWTRLGPLTHRLVTPVMLAHGLWSDPSYVELSLVVEANAEGRKLLKQPEKVPLTKPVKVLVAPKQMKR